MQIGPFTILRTKRLPPALQPLSSRGGWWSIVREPFAGAWQTNQEIRLDNVLTYSTMFACVTLIASDIGKLTLRLVEQDSNGIWTETASPAFSPVLRKPNTYQTINKFIEQWIVSKLVHGNTYVLKRRDNRGVVTSMYVLDPTRVTPLVSTDGAVYYQLKRDDLSRLTEEMVAVPASEIIHDTMVALFHPLIGVSPIYASGMAALQGLSIQGSSTSFFAGNNEPPGILTAPVGITPEQAAELQAAWRRRTPQDIAVLAGDLKYQQLGMSAVDAQLIQQLKWTSETVCSTFHVPPYLVDVGEPPPYANFEPLLLKYHSQCIQSLTTNFEKCLDEGLGLHEKIDGRQYGTEFDIDDLIWMDTATRSEAATKGIGSGAISPNEGRKKYYGLGPVTGGASPMVQQQYYSLAALAERDADAPFAKPTPAPVAAHSTDDDDMPAEDMTASFAAILHRKSLEAQLYAA
jgi:HK97 family phage portal protein